MPDEWPWEKLPEYPERPYVPPVLLLMLAVIVFEALVLEGRLAVHPTFVALVVLLVAMLLVVGAVALRNRVSDARISLRPWMLGCVAVACLVLATGLSGLSLLRTEEAAEALSSTSVSSCRFEVVSDPSETQSGYMCRARALLPDATQAEVWLTGSERLVFGEQIRAIGRFSPNSDDDWGVSSRARGISGRVKVVRLVERSRPSGPFGALVGLRERCLSRIEPAQSPARSLLAGLTLGERAEAKVNGVQDDFAAAGLSHLIAVSGSHLAVVASMLEAGLLLAGLGPKARSVVAGLATGAYVVLCACPASAVRAWVMLLAARAGKNLGRRSHAPSSVALAGIGMCLFNPGCATELGFRLSVSSVCALALFSRYAEAMLARISPAPLLRWGVRSLWPGRIPTRIWRLSSSTMRAIRSTLASSLVCQAATCVESASTFGRLSLVGPLSNVVVGPLFAPIVTLGAVSCAMSWVPVLGDVLISLSTTGCAALLWLVRLVGGLPFASVPVSAADSWKLAPLVVAGLVLLTWPKPNKRQLRYAVATVIACVAVIVVKLVFFAVPCVTVLDVGQGDAILVRQGPHAVLVDTGPSGAIADALARNNVYGLDAIVLTHLHDDHVGGVSDLEGLVGCGRVFVSQGVSDDLSQALESEVEGLTGAPADELAAGDVLGVGNFRLTCLWPRGETDGSENEDSICLLLEFVGGGSSMRMLLTGDAESDVLADVAPAAGDVDVLKVGHHGSKVSITAEEAAELKAEVAVASAGEGNSYGHPTSECVETLEGSGSLFLCTKDVGDVTLEPAVAGVRVRCQRGESLQSLA